MTSSALPHQLKDLSGFVLVKVLNDGSDGGSLNGKTSASYCRLAPTPTDGVSCS